MKQLGQIQNEGVEHVQVEQIGGDIFHWRASIAGPESTPYEGGHFGVDVVFPFDYPLKPPKCVFTTKIYHPNVGPHGEICLDILKNSWNPRKTIKDVLLSLYYLMCTPDPTDALSTDIAAQYTNDREGFNKTATEWTTAYAKNQ